VRRLAFVHPFEPGPLQTSPRGFVLSRRRRCTPLHLWIRTEDEPRERFDDRWAESAARESAREEVVDAGCIRDPYGGVGLRVVTVPIALE
jgi:hypothetical protein